MPIKPDIGRAFDDRVPTDEIDGAIVLMTMDRKGPDVANHRRDIGQDLRRLSRDVRDLARMGPSTLSPAAAAIVREQMVHLIGVVLGNLAGTMLRLGAVARFSTLKLRVFIESRLTNPDAEVRASTRTAV